MKYDISALCRLFGVTPNTIRYYEKIGLIHPEYSERGRRKYAPLDIAELLQVKTLQATGLDLEAIGSHFHRVPEQPIPASGSILRSKLQDLERQIILMEEAKRIVEGYIQRIEDAEKAVPYMKEMTFPAVRMLSLDPFWGRTVKQQQILAQWISAVPSVRMMDEYLTEDDRIISHRPALCIRESVFEKLQPEQAEHTFSVPEARTLEMYIHKPYDLRRCPDQEDIEKTVQKVREVKHWQRMRILASFLFTFIQDGRPVNHIEIWAQERE